MESVIILISDFALLAFMPAARKVIKQLKLPAVKKGQKQEMKQTVRIPKSNIWIWFLLIIAILFGSGIFFMTFTGGNLEITDFLKSEKKIISDSFRKIDIKEISLSDTRSIGPSGSPIPFDTKKADDYVVQNAKKTLKESYDLVLLAAQEWSGDAQLVFIKSIGTVTVDGKSSQWQIVFYSQEKKAGLVMAVWGEVIASKSETVSEIAGHDLPENWYDSRSALGSLSATPKFQTATVSGIMFYYNEDAGGWIYAVQTSLGSTIMHVR